LAISPLTKRLVIGAALCFLVVSGAAAAQTSSDDLFAPAQPPAAAPAQPGPASPAVEAQGGQPEGVDHPLGPGERNVNLEDRVKAVQRRGVFKAHRVSVSGFGSASLSDAFFQKWGGGGQLAYSFSDPFALSLNYSYFHDQTTTNVDIAKEVLSSQLFATRLHSLATADFEWTPVYGKFKFFNSIAYLDFYPFAGFGAAQGETNWGPATEVGLGERVFLTDFFSVGLEAKYAFYVDQAANGPSVLQRVLLLSALVTIWFPGASEGP
jgi:outer membrane beta-barrel protein